MLRISCIQKSLIWENKSVNLAAFQDIIKTLNSPDIVVLPELFSTGFTMNVKEYFEDMNDTSVLWMKKMAVKFNTAICGSLIIKEGSDFYNRFLFISPDGIEGQYDKRHLFRMGEENMHYTAGEKRVVISYRGWRILPQICYDLRFPVWFRNANDYDLLLNVANWPAVRKDVWKILLPARAIENQCYAIGLNRVGENNTGLDHSGNSMMIDYKGVIIDSIDENAEGVITQELNLEDLNSFKEKFPAYLDADNYNIITATAGSKIT